MMQLRFVFGFELFGRSPPRGDRADLAYEKVSMVQI